MEPMVDLETLLKHFSQVKLELDHIKQNILKNQHLNASTVHLIAVIGDEQMTLKQIASQAGLDKSTVSRQMNTLEAEQLVLRTTGKDKRFSFFKLTPSAKIHYDRYLESFTNYLDQALLAWSEEEKQLLLVLLGRMDYSLKQATKN